MWQWRAIHIRMWYGFRIRMLCSSAACSSQGNILRTLLWLSSKSRLVVCLWLWQFKTERAYMIARQMWENVTKRGEHCMTHAAVICCTLHAPYAACMFDSGLDVHTLFNRPCPQTTPFSYSCASYRSSTIESEWFASHADAGQLIQNYACTVFVAFIRLRVMSKFSHCINGLVLAPCNVCTDERKNAIFMHVPLRPFCTPKVCEAKTAFGNAIIAVVAACPTSGSKRHRASEANKFAEISRHEPPSVRCGCSLLSQMHSVINFLLEIIKCRLCCCGFCSGNGCRRHWLLSDVFRAGTFGPTTL